MGFQGLRLRGCVAACRSMRSSIAVSGSTFGVDHGFQLFRVSGLGLEFRLQGSL